MALHRSREMETLTWETYEWVHSGERVKTTRRLAIKSAVLGPVSELVLVAGGTLSASAANAVLKIGLVGVTSGSAAACGTSNVRSIQAREAIDIAAGGMKIGNKT